MDSVKVYFGPFKHSPVDELPLDERRLWFTDYHLLRGVERDFWTSNPLMLDVFDRKQVFLWVDESVGWVDLNIAAILLMPEKAREPMVEKLTTGKLALALDLMRHLAGSSKQGPEAPSG